MKLNKLWASALALLALTACGKDLEPSLAPDAPEAPKTKVVHIDLTAGQDLNDLRVLYNLASDGTGAITGLAMSEKDVNLRIAVKQGSGEPTYQTLTFTKVQGENRATYSGQITIPSGGTGEYKLSAILLSEVGSGAKTFATVDAANSTYAWGFYPNAVVVRQTPANAKQLELPVGNKLDTNVPYVSAWQTVTLSSDGTKLAPTKLKLEPQGTILRFRIKNETQNTYNIKEVDFVTNAFSPTGRFVFTKESAYNVGFPEFIRGDFYPPYSYKLPKTNQTIVAASSTAPSLSPWYYIWVMPTHSRTFDTRVDLVATDGSKMIGVFSTDKPLSPGSVPMTLTIKNTGHGAGFGEIGEVPNEWGSVITKPKLALEYVATKDFNQAGNNFVNDDDPNVGRFIWTEAISKFSSPVVIEGVKYSIPTASEMRSIFPPEYIKSKEDGVRIKVDQPIDVSNFRERAVKIGDITKDYYSDFYGTGNNICYAIRFKDKTNWNKTAFRYERITATDPSGTTTASWKVTCRYIGNNPAISMSQVAQETFWNSNQDEDVTRIFVNRGYFNPRDKAMHIKRSTSWWVSDEYDPDVAYSFEIGDKSALSRIDHKYNGFPVRPFIRN